MNFTLTCKHCGAEIAAETEDELVDLVQEHVKGHGAAHALSRETILGLVHKRAVKEDAA